MTDLTDEALRVARMRAPIHVHVRPMFEVLPDFADEISFSDAAKWPEPFGFHNLDDQEAM